MPCTIGLESTKSESERIGHRRRRSLRLLPAHKRARLESESTGTPMFGALPVEMLELLLIKVVVMWFVTGGKTVEAEKSSFRTLAGVSYCWWKTIRGWPQSRTRHWLKHRLHRRLKPAKWIRTLPVGEEIHGVTQLGDRLYLVRDKPTEQVEVFDTKNFRLERFLSIPGMRGPLDMTSCGLNLCLYISSSSSWSVHRVSIWPKSGELRTVKRWQVYSKPVGLSVTRGCKVLVTCGWYSIIKMFSTWGRLIRRIRLLPHIDNPQHSVQHGNSFAVVYLDDHLNIHRLSTIDTDGEILLTFEDRDRSGVGKLQGAEHLAVDGDEFVFVADVYRQRVLRLNRELRYVREVVSRDNGLVWLPSRLFVDRRGRRLYVADNDKSTAGRLLVFRL